MTARTAESARFRVVRALPTLLRIGVSEAIAYRAELAMWICATTMPFVMLVLWHAVAREAPIGRYGSSGFTGYFVWMFVVRQLTGSWAAWLISMEIREGTMSLRLLRPIHPLVSYAATAVAELPVRVAISVPLAALLLMNFARGATSSDPIMWAIFCAAALGGFLITLFINFAIGSLSFFLESSAKIMAAYVAVFFVASGYLFPVEFFPTSLRVVLDFLPFRYQLGFPVEVITGAHTRETALLLLARQWTIVAVSFGAARLLWSAGIKRFSAVGG